VKIRVPARRERLRGMIDAIRYPPLRISLCRGIGCLIGPQHGDMREVIAMRNGHEATGLRQKWMWKVVILVALLMTSAVPGHAWRGGHGFRHGAHVFIRPHVVFPIGPFLAPYWGPYWGPYGYPSVVVTPPPPVYVQPVPQMSVQPPPAQSSPQPSAQLSWYYCEGPQGYYPYVQQCPGGWRPVAPTPP